MAIQTNIPATLVRLSISMFNNSREDTSITADVKALHKLTGKAGKWVKYKLPEESLEPIRTIANEVRTWNYRVTLPWEDGSRLLPLAAGARHAEQFMDYLDDFNTAVSEFIVAWPEWVEMAKGMHNGTFNEADYPSAAVVRGLFALRMEHSPVPQKSHFVGVLAGAELATRQLELEAANNRKIQEAIRDTWLRLLAPIQKLAETLGSKDAIFRDSLVDNVKDITALVPTLNLTNDAQMKAVAAQITKSFATLNPDTLRENKVMRKATADAAKAIVAKFGSFGGRKFAN